MEDLFKQAEELGIKIDRRWSEKRLQQEIDEALGAPASAKDIEVQEKVEKTFPVRLKKNYRPVGDFTIVDEDGARAPTDLELAKVPAGTVINVSMDEARAIIEKKVAERNDPIG